MNCPQCGTVNSADSRFCGRCGATLPAGSPPVKIPLVGALNWGRITEPAGGLVSILTSVLGAVGLGMAAEFLVKFVVARVAPCACGCLLLAGLLVCIMAAGWLQAVQFK
jgi:hypothetical protein